MTGDHAPDIMVIYSPRANFIGLEHCARVHFRAQFEN